MQPVDGRVHVGEVGGVPVLLLRRADADEVHVGAVRLGHVGREAQAAGGDAFGEDLRQTGLEERRFAPERVAIFRSSTSIPTTSWPIDAMAAA